MKSFLASTLLAALLSQSTYACSPPAKIEGANAPSTGTLKAAAIFVDFSDAAGNGSPDSLLGSRLDDTANFYKNASFGKLTMETTVHKDKFYRIPTESFNYDGNSDAIPKFIGDAVKAVPKEVSFKDVNVLYIFPAKGSQVLFTTSYMQSVTAQDGTEIKNTVVFGADMYDAKNGGRSLWRETGHVMGVPYTYSNGDAKNVSATGGHSITGFVFAQSPALFAVQMWTLGWIDDKEVTCVDKTSDKKNVTLSALDLADAKGNTRLIMFPPSSDSTNTSLAVEIRSNSGVDFGACGSGALFYTSDSSAKDTPIKVIQPKDSLKFHKSGCAHSDGGQLDEATLSTGFAYSDDSTSATVSIVGMDKTFQSGQFEVSRKQDASPSSTSGNSASGTNGAPTPSPSAAAGGLRPSLIVLQIVVGAVILGMVGF